MRKLLLALVACAVLAPVAADAARRDERNTQPARTTQAAKASPAAKPAEPARRASTGQARAAARPSHAARVDTIATRQRAAARDWMANGRAPSSRSAALQPGDVRTQRSDIVVRGAAAATLPREAASSCTRRNGRTVCGPSRDGVAGWQAGLPRADHAQQTCPAGTMAALARGHEDVVRCMPI